jgi:hypothetical protein
VPNELKEQCLIRINHFFYGHSDGLQIHGEINNKTSTSAIFHELIISLFLLYL